MTGAALAGVAASVTATTKPVSLPTNAASPSAMHLAASNVPVLIAPIATVTAMAPRRRHGTAVDVADSYVHEAARSAGAPTIAVGVDSSPTATSSAAVPVATAHPPTSSTAAASRWLQECPTTLPKETDAVGSPQWPDWASSTLSRHPAIPVQPPGARALTAPMDTHNQPATCVPRAAITQPKPPATPTLGTGDASSPDGAVPSPLSRLPTHSGEPPQGRTSPPHHLQGLSSALKEPCSSPFGLGSATHPRPTRATRPRDPDYPALPPSAQGLAEGAPLAAPLNPEGVHIVLFDEGPLSAPRATPVLEDAAWREPSRSREVRGTVTVIQPPSRRSPPFRSDRCAPCPIRSVVALM
jgi:hypothetical protein